MYLNNNKIDVFDNHHAARPGVSHRRPGCQGMHKKNGVEHLLIELHLYHIGCTTPGVL